MGYSVDFVTDSFYEGTTCTENCRTCVKNNVYKKLPQSWQLLSFRIGLFHLCEVEYVRREVLGSKPGL